MKTITVMFIGLSFGAIVALSVRGYATESAFAHDNRIRGDYAGIVNDCYSQNRTGSADAMYSCIESHD